MGYNKETMKLYSGEESSGNQQEKSQKEISQK